MLTKAQIKTKAITHSIARAKERYHLNLTETEYKTLVLAAKEGKGQFMRRVSRTRSIWILVHQYKGKKTKLPVLYCSSHEAILTIFPKSYLKESKKDFKQLLFDYLEVTTMEECFHKVTEGFQKLEQLSRRKSSKEEELSLEQEEDFLSKIKEDLR